MSKNALDVRKLEVRRAEAHCPLNIRFIAAFKRAVYIRYLFRIHAGFIPEPTTSVIITHEDSHMSVERTCQMCDALRTCHIRHISLQVTSSINAPGENLESKLSFAENGIAEDQVVGHVHTDDDRQVSGLVVVVSRAAPNRESGVLPVA